MNQQYLAKWLKLVIIGVALCGIVVYGWVVPQYGQAIVYENPEFGHFYTPWLIFIWLTAIPCYLVLLCAWKIAKEIGADNSFSRTNAKQLKNISSLALFNSALFFTGNIVYLILEMNHPGVVILSLIVVFFGIAIAVASAALSHLVMKAALLQEQSDLTI